MRRDLRSHAGLTAGLALCLWGACASLPGQAAPAGSPLPPLPTPAAADPSAPAPSRPTVLRSHAGVQAPLVLHGDQTYLDLSRSEIRDFLAASGFRLQWDPAAETLTLYSATHYLRWTTDQGSGIVDGRDTDHPGLLVRGSQQERLLSVAGLVELLHVATCARGDGLDLQPVVERAEWVEEAGDRRLVLRASLPLPAPRVLSEDPLRIQLTGVTWAPSEAPTSTPQGRLRIDPPEPQRETLELTLEPPPHWRPQICSRFVAHELAVRVSPAFSLGQDVLAQPFPPPRTWRDDAGQWLAWLPKGCFQYYWSFDPDSRWLTLDIPQGQPVEGSLPTLPEITATTTEVFSTAAFPVLRLRLQIASGYGFELSHEGGDHPEQLRLRLAPAQVLPVTALEGQGGEPERGSGFLVVLDPGHGGSDPGAINSSLGLQEKSITLDICKRLRSELERRKVRVVMTRDEDRDVTWANSPDKLELGARVKVANQLNADLFISVHCNASPSSAHHGTSYHWYKPLDLPLARSLSGALARAGRFTNVGPVKNRFYVLRHSTMPALLVETAYISNPGDARQLADVEVRQRMAEHLAEALTQYQASRTGVQRAASSARPNPTP